MLPPTSAGLLAAPSPRDPSASSPIAPLLSHRHVLAGPTGRGGVTVPTIPHEAAPDAAPGPGLLALADLVVAGSAETRLSDDVLAWREGGSVWLRLPARGLRVVLEQRPAAAALEGLSPAADPGTGRFVWVDVDPGIGEVAARAFAGHGRDDDVVGFQGAMALTRHLARPLLVQLGTGSVVTTRPAPRGAVEIGGAVGPARPSTVGPNVA